MGPNQRYHVPPQPGLGDLEPACTMQARAKLPVEHLLQAVKTAPKSATHSLSSGDNTGTNPDLHIHEQDKDQ